MQQFYPVMRGEDLPAMKSILSSDLPRDINERMPGRPQTTLLIRAFLGKCSASVASLLLSHDADATLADAKGFAPLDVAAFFGRSDLIRILMTESKKKLDVNVLGDDGFSPVHRACWGKTEGHAEALEVLIEFGGDVDTLYCKSEDKCKHIYYLAETDSVKKIILANAKVEGLNQEFNDEL